MLASCQLFSTRCLYLIVLCRMQWLCCQWYMVSVNGCVVNGFVVSGTWSLLFTSTIAGARASWSVTSMEIWSRRRKCRGSSTPVMWDSDVALFAESRFMTCLPDQGSFDTVTKVVDSPARPRFSSHWVVVKSLAALGRAFDQNCFSAP